MCFFPPTLSLLKVFQLVRRSPLLPLLPLSLHRLFLLPLLLCLLVLGLDGSLAHRARGRNHETPWKSLAKKNVFLRVLSPAAPTV